MDEKFNCYSHGEGRTGIGQLVEFSYPIPDRMGNEERNKITVEIKEFFATRIRDIDIPTTGRVNVGHGGYGQYTRYDITQHKYAGGGYPGCGGYIEVLEIKNPPDGRCGIVIYENLSPKGGAFTEWETLEDALNAYTKYRSATETGFANFSGFKRLVVCGRLTPWFYAIGDEELIGDYAFPEGLQDDPIFRFGRQFVVFDSDGIPAIKICMGTRFFQKKQHYHPYGEIHFRLVYWDDGSIWDESHSSLLPRPAEESEMWITEAIQQFRSLLAGKSIEFFINFTNGNKFIGKVIKASRYAPCVEGRYTLVVKLKGEKKPMQGFIDFKPTPALPDIMQFVKEGYARKGKEVEHIEVKEQKTEKGGKKWAGVFFSPPS